MVREIVITQGESARRKRSTMVYGTESSIFIESNLNAELK